MVKEKVEEKEILIKGLLENLRMNLNKKRIEFNQTPNDWQYLTTLSYTENKLRELLTYFEK